MSSEVIKSFMVALGFTVDEAALKKFDRGISAATDAVKTLGKEIAIAVPVLAYGIDKISNNLEQLYFSAVRTGTSATHLKVLQLAAENLGVSAEEAMGNFEALAQSINLNPAMASFLGVRLVDEHGKKTDEKQWMEDLHKRFAAMDIWQAARVAQQGGISYNMMLALRSNDWDAQVTNATKKVGPGFDKAANDAHRFREQLRNVELQLEAFGAKVFDVIERRLTPVMGNLSTWLDKNGDRLAKRMVDGAEKLFTAIGKLGPKIGWLVDKFMAWDKSTNGLSTKIGLSVAALTLLGGGGIITGLGGVAIAIAGIVTSFGALPALVIAASSAIAGFFAFDYTQDWKMTKGAIDKVGNFFKSFKHVNPEQIIQDFMAMGNTREQAIGIAANAKAESGYRPFVENEEGSGAFGLFQENKDSQRQFKKVTGKDFHDASVEEQEWWVNYRMAHGDKQLADAKLGTAEHDAALAAAYFSRFYEVAGRNKAEQYALDKERAKTAITINQTNTITVSDADHVKKMQAVEDALKQQNAQLARTLSSPSR